MAGVEGAGEGGEAGAGTRARLAAARFAPVLPPCQPVEASWRERPGMECGRGEAGGDVKKPKPRAR